MLHAVIMAGGAGTRFWPESRADRPKQFLDLAGGKSMLQATSARLDGLVPAERRMVVTNQRLVQAVGAQLPELSSEAIIGEPCKRDTAPCIGLAATLLHREDPDATMLVMPADHVIEPAGTFQAAVRHAHAMLEKDASRIITFGIRPSYPASTFGYIERDEPVGVVEGRPATYRVRQFHEKPDADVARGYVESGNYYWNSGIFLWKAATILASLERFEPIMQAHLSTIGDALGDAHFGEVLEREFTAIEGKSIDYAVMERYDNVLVVEAPFAWDDVGNWQSLARLRGADEQGNTMVGRHLAVDTRSTIVRSDDEHLVVTVGLEDCIVVHTPEATLVANRHQEEAIRKVVEMLKERGWEQYL